MRVRASWPRLPCSSTVGTPLRLSWRASALAPCLVRVKTMRAARRAGQVDEDRQPVVARDVQDVVGHRRHRRLRRVGLVGHRVGQEPLDQDVDRLVQGRGEQQPLAARGVCVEQTAYGGEEAEVGHVVGLVEHRDLDAASEQWPWPIRSSSRPGQATTMSTPRRRPLHLGVLADAAEDGPGGEPGGLRQRGERLRRSGRRAHGSGPGSAPGGAPGRGRGPTPRAGRRAGAGTRRSCRSRCGRGRARRARPASPAASRPGWGWGCRCRVRRGRSARFAGTPRSVKEGAEDKGSRYRLVCLTNAVPRRRRRWEAVLRREGEERAAHRVTGARNPRQDWTGRWPQPRGWGQRL